jgi:hypothetical protein
MPSVTPSSPHKLPPSSKSPLSSRRLSSANEPTIMPLVTQTADGKTYYSLRIDNLSYEQVKTLHEQVKTLLGGSRNPGAGGNPTTTTTRNYTSNNSELDSIKKNLRPLLFNNKHLKFNKVEDFQLDFNSFASAEGCFGAVHARTPVATPKAKSRASLRIIQAITKSGNNAAERALALHLALINPAIVREILNIKELEYIKDQVKEFLGIVYETKKKHGNVNGEQNVMGATVFAALAPI